MENVINKLIEVDKQARQKVEKAQSRKADVVGEIDRKRKEMQQQIEQEFVERSQQSNLKAQQDFERDYSEQVIKEKQQEQKRKLDELYEKNREKWVRELFEKAVEV